MYGLDTGVPIEDADDEQRVWAKELGLQSPSSGVGFGVRDMQFETPNYVKALEFRKRFINKYNKELGAEPFEGTDFYISLYCLEGQEDEELNSDGKVEGLCKDKECRVCYDHNDGEDNKDYTECVCSVYQCGWCLDNGFPLDPIKLMNGN